MSAGTAQNALRERSRTSGWIDLVLYLIIPSIAWSLVYRDVKIVADVLILAAIEGFVPRLVGRIIRLGWCVLCLTMILLEWNIFPESYSFYLTLMIRAAASFPQGRAVGIGFGLLIVFLALPSPRQPPRSILAMALSIYVALFGAKLWHLTKPHLAWLRQPAPRAAQVAWTDSSRILTSSVAPARYDAFSAGYERLASWLGGSDRPSRILVLLLESWGENPDDFAMFVRTIQESAGSAEMDSGYTAFSGPTLSGEVRELCGKPLSFRSVDTSLSDCLPRRARRVGYAATAFHGYDGYFYNRQIVYPQIGFSRSWFLSDMDEGERCGGAFNGVCDDVVLARALTQFGAPGPQFVYVMSLSGHEPIAAEMIHRPYVRAVAPPGGGPLDSRHVNRALIYLALAGVRRLAREEDVALYVAGDHNPPGQEDARGLPNGKVPYLLLRWRHGP